MQLSVFVVLLASSVMAVPSQLVPRKNACGTDDGVINGQCGSVWSGKDCTGELIWNIQPDCSQACIKVTDQAIQSVKASGDGTYGTTCYMYSDENCNDEISRTDNVVIVGPISNSCSTPQNSFAVKAWKCTWGC